METITDWGDAMLTSLTGGLAMMFAAIPKLIGFALILVIGWVVSGVIAKLAATVLRKIRTDELAERAGLADFIQKMGMKSDTSGFLAGIVKWFMRLIVLIVAFDALGLPAVSDVIRQVLLWLPNLAVGIAVLIVGGLAAKAFSRVLKGSMEKAGIGNPQTMAAIASVAIWAFAIIIAANQIGVAQTLVNTLFMGAVAMLALALGLAFGLGGKDTAGQIVNGWYADMREAKPKIAQAANDATRTTNDDAEDTARAVRASKLM